MLSNQQKYIYIFKYILNNNLIGIQFFAIPYKSLRVCAFVCTSCAVHTNALTHCTMCTAHSWPYCINEI